MVNVVTASMINQMSLYRLIITHQALLIDYCAIYMGYKSTHIMNATCDPAFRHIFAIRYGLYIGRLLFLCPRVAK